MTALLTLNRARTPVIYTVKAVLRVTEGSIRSTGTDLGAGVLRAYIRDLTFTRARLTAVMNRHLDEFPDALKEPEDEVLDFRDRISVVIAENDFIGDRNPEDPPRSARITLSFDATKPKAAWDITQELVDMLIDSARARQRAGLLRERAGAESVLASAVARAAEAPGVPPQAALNRVAAVEGQLEGARLSLRAAEEQQTLRFELVDPGRMPERVSRAAMLGDVSVTLVLALIAAWLLGGAFDARVIDAFDLRALGVPLLGRLPPLPPAAGGKPAAGRPSAAPDDKQFGSPATGEDSDPRV